jgi:hypothetical protein
MSGLESIALAVAHLEEQQALHIQERNQQAPPLEAPTSIAPPLAPPAPQSFSSSNTPRVVSFDSISSYEQDTTQSHNDSNDNSLSSTIPSIAGILSDPSAWLNATENKTIPSPPTDETIAQVCHDDVLCGRGGETNHHQGNIQYRNLVKAFQPLYIISKRRDKPRIAQCIVYSVRMRGGRFLKRTDPRSNTWTDVGNTKAREKTSQALREGAPELRGTERQGDDVSPTPSSSSSSISASLMLGHSLSQPAFMATTLPPGPFPPHAGILTPLQQAMSRALLTTPPAPASSLLPVAVTPPFYEERKRPSLLMASANNISDGDDASDESTSDSSIGRGPRLKRLKLRLEMDRST